MDGKYKIIEANEFTNPTNLAAAASEVIVTGTQRVAFYNSALVINTDAVKIRITLDNDAAKIYDILPKTGMTIEPWEGTHFRSVLHTNMDAAAAETAGLIQFKFWNKEEV